MAEKGGDGNKKSRWTNYIKGQISIHDVNKDVLSVYDPGLSDLTSSLDDYQKLDDQRDDKTIEELKLPSIWKEVTGLYKLQCWMGEGSYGTVIKGLCRNSGVQVAIKLIKGFTKYDYDCVKLVREI